MQDDPKDQTERYWRSNLKLVFALLFVWFACSYGAAILFVEPLNELTFTGFPLGFWFAHQGSIVIFIVLIAIYCIKMDKLDAAYAAPIDPRRSGDGDASSATGTHTDDSATAE